MSGDRSCVDGRDPVSPGLWGHPFEGPGREREPKGRASRAVPEHAARAFAQALRGEDTPAGRVRRHGMASGDGAALDGQGYACDADADVGHRCGREHGHADDHDRQARDVDEDARLRDVRSLFAMGATGFAATAPSSRPATREPAPRDVIDDVFTLVAALRGDAFGTAVIELDMDARALPGVSIRIAEVDARLCFTFFCQRPEIFRRLAGHAATMAELLHERLARPVGVALRHVSGDVDDVADRGVDVDVEAG